MASLIVELAIPADKYLLMYEGAVDQVLAYSSDGRKVRFPANILRPFVTREGVYGRFAIHFDQNNKLRSIERV